MTIKKSIIFRQDLPPINTEIDGYAVRYRIVSDDKNKVSAWSNVYTLKPNLFYISGQLAIAKQSSHVSLIWDPVKIKPSPNSEYSAVADLIATQKEYDIWVRWSKGGLGDWRYEERIEGTSANLIIPNYYFYNGQRVGEKPNELTIEIRLPGSPITRDYAPGLLYLSATETV